MNRNYYMFLFSIIVISSSSLHAIEEPFSSRKSANKIGTVEVIQRIAAQKMKRSASQGALCQRSPEQNNCAQREEQPNGFRRSASLLEVMSLKDK